MAPYTAFVNVTRYTFVCHEVISYLAILNLVLGFRVEFICVGVGLAVGERERGGESLVHTESSQELSVLQRA